MRWHINCSTGSQLLSPTNVRLHVPVVKVRAWSASVSLKKAILPIVCLFRRIRGYYNVHLGVKVSNTVKFVYTGTSRDRNFSVAARFRFMQILEVWTLGTVLVYHQRKVSVMTKFGLREAHSTVFVMMLHK